MDHQRRAYRPKHGLVAAKPAGGYLPVNAGDLLNAWRLYQSDGVELRDLRLWFASHELRKADAFRGSRLPESIEGDRLVRFTGDRGSASVVTRRLTRLDTALNESPVPECPYFRNLRRTVPVPRRLIHRLSSGGSRAMIAAAVGHLLRCMYLRGRVCVSGGTAKASCLAEALGVSVRSIRRGRKQLQAEGWLQSVDVPQHVLNRHGAVVRVRSGDSPRRLAPPRQSSRPGLAPPKNQHQLRCLSRTGSEERGGSVKAESAVNPARSMACSALSTHGLPESDALVLAVRACWHYARRKATRSTSGLFWHLVGNARWDRPSIDDEDAARHELAGVRMRAPVGAADHSNPERASDVAAKVLRFSRKAHAS